MNTITYVGRLGKDGELKYTQTGTPLVSFSVASDNGYGDRKETLWFNTSLFGKRAESLAPYLTKGGLVHVLGQLQAPYLYTGKDGNPRASLNVKALEVDLLGGGETRQEPEKDYDGQIPF